MFDVSALVTPKNPKDLKILKSFEVAQSIFCLQAPCLAKAFVKLVLIHSQLPPTMGHHPDLPTCTWCPGKNRLWVMINRTFAVHIHQSSRELKIGDAAIGTHFEHLLVEGSQSAQDRCLCRVGKRQTKNQQRPTLKDKPNFRTL